MIRMKNLEFNMDWVFDGRATQEELYERTALGSVARVLDGFNCTIFSYGQTSSGKTYTLHRLFGLENLEMLDTVEMLDLDSAMRRHPEYDTEKVASMKPLSGRKKSCTPRPRSSCTTRSASPTRRWRS